MLRALLLSLTALLAMFLVSLTPTQADDKKPEDKKPDDKKPDDKKPEDKQNELIGKAAPEIAGDFAINGKDVNLADLKGKVVLIDFWAVWCGPCIKCFPHLRDWHKDYKSKGLEIVGLTSYYGIGGIDKDTGGPDGSADKATVEQENAMLRDFVAFHKLDHRIQTVSQEEWKKIANGAYQVRGIPTLVLIDRKGIVRMIKIGSGEENAKAIEAEIKKLLDEKD